MSRLRDAVDHNSEHLPGTGADKLAFVHRLQLILAHWPSADRLARAMGVSPSAFRKWLKGEAEPSRERLIALAHAAGVGVAWLAEGEGPEPSFETNGAGRRHPLPDPGDGPDWNQFVILPDNGSANVPAAGAPARNPVPARYLALRQDWVRIVWGVDPAHVVLDVAVDESMAPTIKAHDSVLLDTAERKIVIDGIYMLNIGGQRQIRRVQRRHDGSLVLISDNQAYHPDIVENEAVSTITVLGRVVWVGGPVA
ncbi:MAG TPA: S24 family peptidase [Rhodopila sp.]|nr:S24 family peptidase [Rhodopila sp.]